MNVVNVFRSPFWLVVLAAVVGIAALTHGAAEGLLPGWAPFVGGALSIPALSSLYRASPRVQPEDAKRPTREPGLPHTAALTCAFMVCGTAGYGAAFGIVPLWLPVSLGIGTALLTVQFVRIRSQRTKKG